MAETQKDNKSFKDSLKATSLFGGVQVFSILIQLIRSKVIALLLGPSGMGVYGLYTQTQALIRSCTSFGLSSSAVRNISEARGTGDEQRVKTTVSAFRKLVWITGTLGLLVCLLGSPLWSKLTFGNYDYTLGFVILSVALLFEQLTSGQTTIFQGLRRYAYMAKANVLGNLFGLIITIPLYYLWGIDAIVPVIVITTIIALSLSWVFYRKLHFQTIRVDKPTFIKEGKNMVIMGLSISFSGIVSTAIAYYLRTYIGDVGGLSEVGLFTAGFAMVETYVGLVLTSMGTDYYPRLSEVNKDTKKFNETINSQMQIALLLVAPVITIFIIFIELAIEILYSSKFIPAEGMMYWAIYGCIFKAISWCISFGFLAKGDYKAFITNEIGTQFYSLPLRIIGYNVAGLTGVGVAYLLTYFLYAIQVYLICHFRYQVNIGKDVVKIFLEQIPMITVCLLATMFIDGWFRYVIGIPIIILSVWLSYYELEKKIDIKGLVLSKLYKK